MIKQILAAMLLPLLSLSCYLPVPPQSPPQPEPPAQMEAPPATHTLHVLMYHHVVPDGVSCNVWTVTESQFRSDLQWLADHGYTTLLPSQLSGGLVPERSVLLTFDDGYASNYELAFPILQEFQAKAVISVITKRVEDGLPDFLTWEMCREMSQSGLIEFGSHTHNSHSAETRGVLRLPGERRSSYEARVFPDIQTSIDLLERQLGVTPTFFAYPHGETEPWADAFIREHFSVSVTTLHGPADLSGGLHRLSRYNISTEYPVSSYLPA